MNRSVWALSLSYMIAINIEMSLERSIGSSSDLKDVSQANNQFYRPNNLNHERFVRNATEDVEPIMNDNDKLLIKKDVNCIVADLMKKALEHSKKTPNKGNESVLSGRIFHKTLQKLKRPLKRDESGFVMDSRVKSIPLYSDPIQAAIDKSMPTLYNLNRCSALAPNPDETDLPYKNTNINIDPNVTIGDKDVQDEGDDESINKTKLTNSKTDLIKFIISVYPFQVGFLDGSLIRNLYRRRNTIGPFKKRRATQISLLDKCEISTQSNSLNNDVKGRLSERENAKKIINDFRAPKYSFTTSRIESHQVSKVYTKLNYPNQKCYKDDLNHFQNLLYPFLRHDNVQSPELKGRDVNIDHLKIKNLTLPLEQMAKNVSLLERDQTSNSSEEPYLKIRAKNGPVILTLRYDSKNKNNTETPNSGTLLNYGNGTSFSTTFSLLKNNSVALRDIFFDFTKPFNFSRNNINALNSNSVSNSKKTSKTLKTGLLDLFNLLLPSPRDINVNKDSNNCSDFLIKSPDEEVVIVPGNEYRNKGQPIENKGKLNMENKTLNYKTNFQLVENISNDPSSKILSLFSNIPDPRDLDHEMNNHVERKNKPLIRNFFQITKLNPQVNQINNSIPFLKATNIMNETSLSEISDWINSRKLSSINDLSSVDLKKYIILDQSNHEFISNPSLMKNIKTYKELPTAMHTIEVSNKNLTNHQICLTYPCKQVMSGQG